MTVNQLLWYLAADTPAVPHNITLAPANSGAVAYGPDVALASDPAPSPFSALVFRHPDYRTPVGTLTGRKQWSWQDQIDQVGTATMLIPLDHADIGLVEPDDLIRHYLNGRAAFASIASDFMRVTESQTGGPGQTEEIGGPGHLGLLAEAVVLPARGFDSSPTEETRPFNWASVDFEDAGWRWATLLGEQQTPSNYWTDLPTETWPDPHAQWIWAHTGTQEYAAEGWCYFRATTDAIDATWAMVYLTADDRANLYIDGQLIVSTDNGNATPTDIRTAMVYLTAGGHTIGVAGYNAAPDPALTPGTHNPGGVLYTILPAAADGTITSDTPIINSNAANKVSEYPPGPPGMTIGEVLTHVLDEAQAYGLLDGWEWSFDEQVDSNGTPWAVTADIATDVGRDLRTFILDELCQTYCDVRAQPGGLVLDAYNFGTMDNTPGVTYRSPTDVTDPTSGNLTALTHQRRAVTATMLMVKWPGGWHMVDATPPGERPKMALLGLGYVPSVAELERIAAQQLVRYADVRTAIVVGVEPRSDTETPGLGVRVGDTVQVPDIDGDLVDARVLSVTVEPGDHGHLRYSVEIADVIATRYEADATALKKMVDGTLRGDSRPASPVSAITATPANCCPPQPPVEEEA